MKKEGEQVNGLPKTQMTEWLGIVELAPEDIAAADRAAERWRGSTAGELGCVQDAQEGSE